MFRRRKRNAVRRAATYGAGLVASQAVWETGYNLGKRGSRAIGARLARSRLGRAGTAFIGLVAADQLLQRSKKAWKRRRRRR